MCISHRLLMAFVLLVAGCSRESISLDTAPAPSAPAGLSYRDTSVVYAQGVAIIPNVPSNSGGAITQYTVAPRLPAGLRLDPQSGVISGTPTTVTNAAVYTVTGSNAGGNSTTRLDIEVKAAVIPPASLSYSVSSAVLVTNTPIHPHSPTSSGGEITHYSVSPPFPAGLAIDAQTGVISGTPTTVTAPVVYTVTGSNSAGSVDAPLTIEVQAQVVPPTGLVYTDPQPVYTVGLPIVDNVPHSTGGEIDRFSISPPLPAGLGFDTQTGIISGTPSTILAQTLFTVIGSNSAGSATAQIAITLVAPPPSPPGLSYRDTTPVYTQGVPIIPNVPHNSGGPITLYTVAPALPAGLGLDPQSGVISGTPTTVTNAALYAVTGSNAGGSSTTRLQIEVKANVIPPDDLSYPVSSVVLFTNTPVHPQSPTSSGGEITHYGVSPPLPAGLAIDAQTGVISGTPTTVTAPAVYTVTGSNSAGSVDAPLTIEVQAQIVPPTTLTYLDAEPVYTVGLPIVDNTPQSTGGEIDQFSISPPLPAGLGFDTQTGIISGTPSAVLAQTLFTVIGSNSAGSVTAQIVITVADPVAGEWLPADNMNDGRGRHTATLLPDGKVLVAGGFLKKAILSSAELYDPPADTWTTTGSMGEVRQSHTATLLGNGKVLVAGGLADSSQSKRSSAELFDPAAGTWSATGSMGDARESHTATLLGNGKVLVVGGAGVSVAALASAELYDPGTGTWSPTGSLNQGRSSHTATLLADGRVLVAGGSDTSFAASSSAEIYDPSTGTWTLTSGMNQARVFFAATLLASGKVLVSGGKNGAFVDIPGAELYDPAAGAWSQTGDMALPRSNYPMTLLQDGSVLVTGGTVGSKTLALVEHYDSAAGTWSDTGSLAKARSRLTATLLPDGRVLAAGGALSNGNASSSADLFN